jgi:hypothetical protein
MCVEVLVYRPDGSEVVCSSVAELAEALGVAPVTLWSEAEQYGADVCLCNVELEAYGARQATEAEDYPFVGFAIDRRPA